MTTAINGVGSEAVKWLVSNGAARTAEEAVELGNALLELGLLAHVVRCCSGGAAQHHAHITARLRASACLACACSGPLQLREHPNWFATSLQKQKHTFKDSYLFYRFTRLDPGPGQRARHVRGCAPAPSQLVCAMLGIDAVRASCPAGCETRAFLPCRTGSGSDVWLRTTDAGKRAAPRHAVVRSSPSCFARSQAHERWACLRVGRMHSGLRRSRSRVGSRRSTHAQERTGSVWGWPCSPSFRSAHC